MQERHGYGWKKKKNRDSGTQLVKQTHRQSLHLSGMLRLQISRTACSSFSVIAELFSSSFLIFNFILLFCFRWICTDWNTAEFNSNPASSFYVCSFASVVQMFSPLRLVHSVSAGPTWRFLPSKRSKFYIFKSVMNLGAFENSQMSRLAQFQFVILKLQHLPQLFGRMLQFHFAMKLLKHFVVREISSKFHQKFLHKTIGKHFILEHTMASGASSDQKLLAVSGNEAMC